MTLNYTIEVRDPRTGGTVVVLAAELLRELRMTVKVNEIGALALTVVSDEAYVESLLVGDDKEDFWLLVSRNSVYEAGYLLTSTQKVLQPDGTVLLVIGGLSFEQLISRRFVDPYSDQNLPNGGFVTKAGPADDIIVELLEENLTNLVTPSRAFPGVVVATSGSIGTGQGVRLRYEELWDEIKKLLRAGNVDLKITPGSGNTLTFEATIIGTDRSFTTNYPGALYTILAVQRGNLLRPNVLIDTSEEKTFIAVAAPGEGVNRFIFEQENTERLIASPYGRKELYVELAQGDLDSLADLPTIGVNYQREHQRDIQFDFAVESNQPGSTYRDDWFIGDIITGEWGSFRADVRIMQVEFIADESGETITATVEKYR